MNITTFQQENVLRCESGAIIDGKPVGGFARKISEWSLERWCTALVGEIGEAANVVKKLFRGVDLTTGMDNSELRVQLGKEIADCFAYLVLLASANYSDLDVALAMNNSVLVAPGLEITEIQRRLFTSAGGQRVRVPEFWTNRLAAAVGKVGELIESAPSGVLLGYDLARVAHALFGLASCVGVNLETVTIDKFNEVSKRIGYERVLKP